MQELLKKRRRSRRGRTDTENVYLLTGKVYCGICGGKYCGNSQYSGRKKTLYYCYRCNVRSRRGGIGCSNREISRNCLKKYVLRLLADILFDKDNEENTLGEFLASVGKTQLHNSETEKYAHVTFFFNGGVEEPNKGEDRILVKSPKVATYDLQPEMSAPEVCDKLCAAIRSEKYDVIIINFANPDMVGHTGILDAAIKAVETVDTCVGKAVEALKEVDGQMFICADHGNAEQLVNYETGEPLTSHTTNPVPFILVNADPSYTLKEDGCLADIIPTMIELMGMEQPAEMTGKSLLIKK